MNAQFQHRYLLAFHGAYLYLIRIIHQRSCDGFYEFFHGVPPPFVSAAHLRDAKRASDDERAIACNCDDQWEVRRRLPAAATTRDAAAGDGLPRNELRVLNLRRFFGLSKNYARCRWAAHRRQANA